MCVKRINPDMHSLQCGKKASLYDAFLDKKKHGELEIDLLNNIHFNWS